MYFKLKSTKAPDADWARKLPRYLGNKFRKAFSETEFVDRDHLDQNIIELPFIPINYKDVSIIYGPLIAIISNFTETKCIWRKVLPTGFIDPITTFTVIGYEEDVLMALRIFKYTINGYNNLKTALTNDYRRVKLNRRRRHQVQGKELRPSPHSTLRANRWTILYISELLNELYKIDPQYSVLHENKITNIEWHIMMYTKLDLKAYNTSKPKIEHAYCRPSLIILNRVIV